MPNLARITAYIHMTIQTALLIETFKALSSDLHWCYFKSFPTQYHTVALITHDKSDAVISWKGESLEEYWDCILDDLI